MKVIVGFITLTLLAGVADAIEPSPLVWTTHGNRAAESIPAGNGDIGVNVWTEENGDLLLYIGKTDAFDESCRLLKLGRLRVHFSNNPFAKGQPFRQELDLLKGEILIAGGQGANTVTVRVWADANQPVVHLETDAATPIEQTVRLELWRFEKRPLQQQPEKHGVDGLSATEPPMQYPDTVVDTAKTPGLANQLVWYHRNEVSVQPVSLKLQGLDPAKCAPDPLLGRTFGCAVAGDGFVPENPTTLKISTPATRTHVIICPLTLQTSATDWLKALAEQSARLRKLPLELNRTAHRQWWGEF